MDTVWTLYGHCMKGHSLSGCPFSQKVLFGSSTLLILLCAVLIVTSKLLKMVEHTFY